MQRQFEGIRDKYGPGGSDRTRLMNYFMSKSINLSLNDPQKYLMRCLTQNEGIHSGMIKTKLDKIFVELMNIETRE
jgi:hypothetical protein